MKFFLIYLIILLFSVQFAVSQKVDSIKVEQSGDFIKIRYQILNSNSGQVFRVKVLCSINGGLNTELRSVSGDTGDHVTGGQPEYWVVWDVLKDVDEIKSVEFIVRAEMVIDKSSISISDMPAAQTKVNETGWDKKKFTILLSIETNGPKFGTRIGYLGSWGISAKYVKGKTARASDADNNARLGTIPVLPVYSIDLTKRIINIKGFQMHLAAGLARGKFVFYEKTSGNFRFINYNLYGPEAGMFAEVKRVAVFMSFSKFFTGRVDKGTNLLAWSADSSFDFGLGIRF
ncbi:MAG: hypothetical protein EPN88_16955 [Bacteroidetes bacterium]|nr:MAG: hypothetical protein EPN88_16955 [Bacteroidota bacterium]